MSRKKSSALSRPKHVDRCTPRRHAELVDYWTGDLRGQAGSAFEAHLFGCDDCGRRLAELDALARGIDRAARAGGLSTVVDEAVLNRLARDGVRVRTFTVAPGDVVPCAVWDGDEVIALRLQGNFRGMRRVTVVQRVGRKELVRETDVPVGRSEVILAKPAAFIRETPTARVDIRVTGRAGGVRRLVGAYTLQHGGTLQREAQ
jgi:hypothetical protein